jgi:CHAT domain-containing protein
VSVTRLGPAAPLAARVRRVHAALAAGHGPSADALDVLAAALLADDLLRDEAPLIVSPDGLFSYLPFEVLPLGGRPLVEQATVSYLPTGALAVAGGPPRPRWGRLRFAGFAVSGGVAVGEGLPELRHAEGELATVAATIGGRQRLFRGSAATEAAFRAMLAGRPRVLHVAAHAVVDEGGAGRSAVLLAPSAGLDGRLRPREVARSPGGAQLVVLAACRTALPPPGEEARALATFTGSFLAAGSGAVVATLWDVDDAATAVFMKRFYRELRRGGAPAAALRAAKLQMRADPRWRNPALWSAYVLTGEAPPVVPGPWRRRLLAAASAAAAVALWVWSSRRRTER